MAAAVGLETDRGDQLTVENVSFEEPPVEEPVPPTVLQKYAPQFWEGSRILMVGVLGFLALILFVKPLMRRAGVPAGACRGRRWRSRRRRAAAIPVPGQPIRTVADLESEIEAQLDASVAPTAEQRRLPVLTKRVAALSAQEPENVAKLLRHWISEAER